MRRSGFWPVVMTVILALIAQQVGAADLSVDGSNRYYVDSAGVPRFLIGYYGWAAVPDGYFIDHPSRYAAMMREGSRYKLNYIRISLGVNRFNGGLNGSGRATPVPFAYIGDKVDLDRWDPVFWEGLKKQCRLAKQQGFVAHLAIFDGVELRPQGGAEFGYHNSFWNPANQIRAFYPDPDRNHDGGIEQNGEFYQVESFRERTGLGAYQRKLIEKVIAETKGFDNVFFEIGNELLSSPSDWSTAVIEAIKAGTRKPVSQCGGGAAANGMGWSEHLAGTPAEVKARLEVLVGKGQPAWEDPDGSALSDLKVSPDDLRRAAWYAFVGGSPCWGGFTVDFWTGGPGFNKEKAEYYHNLQQFIETSGVPFWRMSPTQKLVSHPEVNSCLAREGAAYLVYVLNDKTVTIDLGAATGKVAVRTYDPRNGAWSAVQTLTGGGIRTFNRPAGADDWVVYATAGNRGQSHRS